MYPTYISKHNSTREKQIILLMIPIKEKDIFLFFLHYLAVKEIICIIIWNNFKT